jgi:hypothetical protein
MTAALVLERPPTMTPPPESVPQPTDEQLLAALPSAVTCARRFVRYTLETWQVRGLIDEAENVVAELVTDAVAATGLGIEHPTYLDLHGKQLGLVNVRLALVDDRVLIEVWDADRTPPWPREPAAELAGADPSGAVAKGRSWNCYFPPTGGKVVRIELEIQPSIEDTQVLALPLGVGVRRRARLPPPASPIDVVTDPVLLQRLLDGLRRLPTDRPQGEEPTNPDTAREDS